MLDYIAYVIVQQRTEELAWAARPDSPVRPEAASQPSPDAIGRARRAVSAALRRCADRLDVAVPGRIDPMDACR